MSSRAALKTLLRGLGLGFVLQARRAWQARHQAIPVDREATARRHLRGHGLEIGPLHAPIPVPEGVSVRFVDLFSREDNIERFPDLPAEEIVEPDLLEDGFDLHSVAPASQDFVIASHVLEHSHNPIQVLLSWSRVTRPGGVLYLIVPIAEGCFDAGREPSTLSHWIEDYELCARGEREAMRERDRQHYREWVSISEPRIFRAQGHDFAPPSEEAVAIRVQQLLDDRTEIHFHTFSPESFRALLEHFCRVLRPGSRLLELNASAQEVIGVVQLA